MPSKVKKKKLRIGWFTFTCSEDSSIILLELLNEHYFEWKERIDFAHCKMLKSKNDSTNLDVAFVEGAISTDTEKKKLSEIRKNAKKLVAVGACACTGMPSSQRNNFDEKTKNEIEDFLRQHSLWSNVLTVKDVVNADDSLPGCPMDGKMFVSLIDRYFVEFGVV
ncbi:MAG: hypothetical protein AABW86_05740 [Candidatus Micrarchaeota archaeon]